MQEDRCPVCNTKYKVKEAGAFQRVELESVKEYDQQCQKCKYTSGIKEEVEHILETETKVIFTRGKGMSMNTDELTDLIMKEVINNWPQPKK